MSEDDSKLLLKGEEFLTILRKGENFTRELLRENERLRRRMAEIEDEQHVAARTPEDWGKLRMELLGRIASLEKENEGFRERLFEIEDENRRFADRFVEIEEENNNLANLYVASYQLHSTLNLEEVTRIVVEIVINLIGAEVFALYMVDGRGQKLQAVASEGADAADFPDCTIGEGVIGQAVLSSEATTADPRAPSRSRPIVIIPLHIHDEPIGAIAIYSLLQQKDGFSALDHELFNVLGGHAATALFAARLYSHSERKLNTIQGFLDLLAQ